MKAGDGGVLFKAEIAGVLVGIAEIGVMSGVWLV